MYSVLTIRGIHDPTEAMMHFPLFQISPLFAKKFRHSVENFPDFTFSRTFFRFSSAEISDDFFYYKFSTSPIFPVSLHFPLFRKNCFPYFKKFPPVFVKFTCFLHTLYVFPIPLL